MERVVLIGAGAQGRELFDLLADLNAVTPRYEVLGWLVEPPYGDVGTMVRDRPILGDLTWLRGRGAEVQVVCGVGEPGLRRRLVERACEHGAYFCNAIHPRAVLGGPVAIGTGVMIAAGTVVNGDVRLGDHVHVNIGCTISHDAVLEDFATVSPGAHLAGGVHVGEGALIGTGANLLPGVRVGAWSIVGAGCTAIRDVPAHATVVGVPGRVIRRGTPS